MPGPVRLIRRASRLAAQRLRFYARHRTSAGPRILYLLTPPPRLRNVGDHAQAVAIRAWMRAHYPQHQVVELDKDQTRRMMPVLQRVARPDDLVLLHSGGNLGDRGLWSETVRRSAIRGLAGSPVVSLPQTISFSDTPTGHRERQRTRAAYADHPRLMVIGRDAVSGAAAEDLFPGAVVLTMPDFVLSLPPRAQRPRTPTPAARADVLLCLRRDDESALGEGDRAVLEALPHRTSTYDTTLDRDIAPQEREAVLDEALALFEQADAVVTDRFHGVIFSVLTRTPVVVLATVDHKLTSAMDWFADVPWVTFASSTEQVPELVERALAQPVDPAPDFNALHFDRLPDAVAQLVGRGAGGGARPQRA